MYLIHRVLNGEAQRVRDKVDQLTMGGSLQGFSLALDGWAAGLMYRIERESQHLAPMLARGEANGAEVRGTTAEGRS